MAIAIGFMDENGDDASNFRKAYIQTTLNGSIYPCDLTQTEYDTSVPPSTPDTLWHLTIVHGKEMAMCR